MRNLLVLRVRYLDIEVSKGVDERREGKMQKEWGLMDFCDAVKVLREGRQEPRILRRRLSR
jgi:hypothetical protein